MLQRQRVAHQRPTVVCQRTKRLRTVVLRRSLEAVLSPPYHNRDAAGLNTHKHARNDPTCDFDYTPRSYRVTPYAGQRLHQRRKRGRPGAPAGTILR